MDGWALFAVMCVLQAADGWTTYQGLRYGARERNPIANWLMDALGTVPAIVVIKGVVIVVAWLLIPQPEYLAGLVIVYALVVWNNWKWVRLYKD